MKLFPKISRIFLIALVLVFPCLHATPGLGLSESFVVTENPPAGAFPLVSGGVAAPLWHDAGDHAGVIRAIGDLRADVQRVTTLLPALSTAATPPSVRPVIIGTVGKCALIDALIASGKLSATDLAGKWESFVITTVDEPFPGVDQALVIAGSDKRGTIFGIYELSEQLGVSPWYWWADVPVKTRVAAHVIPGRFASGEPVVKYRGIFLNDEAPALTGWTQARFGGRNSQFYTKVFELLLRLRANYLWPAMWGDAFSQDDPLNPLLADEYGIVMGTSHHEPMMRAQQEWSRGKSAYGNAEWNYLTNPEGLRQFWTEGVIRNRAYENIYTVGMRGDGDLAAPDAGGIAANIDLLETIVTDQRAILAAHVAPDVTQVPQLWALYKEVQGYIENGMEVPDDVTLLWCDDNWGNIRRLPTTAERSRSGGAGVYYHFDYVGGPRSYKWLNTNPLPKIQEQMRLAWQHDANRIWIVNVGDLKPMEVPMEFFLRMAWDPARWATVDTADYLRQWATREFGPVHADEVAYLVAGYAKINGRRKPELISPTTFSLQNYREAERVSAEWSDLVVRTNALHALLPAAAKDAFYQLVSHPVLACANLHELYIAAARNALHATQTRASTNTLATRVQTLFQYDASLTTFWNTDFAGGKWIRLMDQTHIGYTSWNAPSTNIMPAVVNYTAPATSSLGVVLEGSTGLLDAGGVGTLPTLHAEGGSTSRYIEVFRRGTLPVSYTITTNQPWATVSPASGTLGDDVRAEVSIDWSRAPVGTGEVLITVQSGAAASTRTVRLPIVKNPPAAASLPIGFLDPEGYIAIEAPNYDQAVAGGGVTWRVEPDHGRALGGVTTLPVLADSIASPGGSSPHLAYNVYLRRKGELTVRLVLSPVMNYVPGRPVRCAISFGDQPPQIVEVGLVDGSAAWANAVRDSVRVVTTALQTQTTGAHVLKFWMVDPGVVLQRIEIDTGGLLPSYLGPPESPRGRRVADAYETPGEAVSSSVLVEAESGQLGADYVATQGLPAFLSINTNGAGSNPGSAARVARYQVTFPGPGTYRLFARVRVGPGAANDDSLFLPNGFGAKNPTLNGDWRSVNNFSGNGYTNGPDVVPYAIGGTAGVGVWKWIDASAFAAITYTVSAGALTQTFDIGGREDGLDIDKFIFGLAGNVFTVDDLLQATSGSPTSAAVHSLEAEASQYGAELLLAAGPPAHLTVSTSGTTMPGSAARVMRFPVTFSGPGTYRLFIRLRVGPDGANDDSLFLGDGFGAKDPAVASQWKTVNNFATGGFSAATDVVTAGAGGTAGINVWKWLDLSALGGVALNVQSGALSQVLDLGGREDGLAIDKIVFAPVGFTYTVADLDAGRLGQSLPNSPIFTASLDDTRQVIDGFGASSAWTAASLSDAWADQFFSPTTGLGLSLLRVRIAPNGTTAETVTAQRAVARGVAVWATPWTPPAEWKSNNDANNGGTLLPEFHAAWAARLGDFVVSMNNAGVPLLALSAQNEPNYTATWESCVWTPTSLSAFIRDHLGPALVSRNVPTRVMAPEVINSGTLAPFADALLGDAVTRGFISQLATHSYGGPLVPYPAAAAQGVPLWQTEFTDSGADTDPTIDSALRVGNAIHDFLAIAEGNAWHYWWLFPRGDNPNSTGSLVENGVMAKRGWALGNWARFVRPGHRRVTLHGSVETVRATAFVSPTTRRLTVVVVNSDAAARTVPLAIEGGGVPSLTPWETSASRSLTGLSLILPASDGSFTLNLPARSVMTFVSESLNRAPSALALDAASVLENRPAGTIVGHLSASDPDSGETFTYTLAAGAGDEGNAGFSIIGNQLRTTAPLDFEVGPARSVRIRATDSLGASHEQTWTITVLNDTAEYADWALALPESQRGANQDPNGDGFANLLAYAFGSTATGSVPFADRPSLVAAGTITFTFTLPSPAPADVRYEIERSVGLGPWSMLASKDGNGAWSGSASVTTEATPDGRSQIRMVAPIQGDSAFFRLRCILRNSPPP